MSKRFLCVACGALIAATLLLSRLGESPRASVSALEAPATAAMPRERPSSTEALAHPIAEPARGRKRPELDRAHPRFTPEADGAAIGGWVEIAEGLPATAATVTLLDQRGAALAEGECDPSGVFYVKSKARGAHRLLALAPGLQPKVVDVELEHGRASVVDPIQLERGETIEGRVTSDGAPLERVEVQARSSDFANAVVLHGRSVVARDGGFVWAHAAAETRADGTYTISGLTREPRHVELAALRGRDNALDTSRARPRDVATPATGVDFDLPSAKLELEFHCAGAPVAGVEVQLDTAGRQFTRRSDETGRLALRVTPAPAYPLIASRGGFATKHAQVPGLMRGEERAQAIELEPAGAVERPSTWTIHVLGSEGGDTADIEFERAPNASGEASGRTLHRRVQRESNAEPFVVTDPPEGRWRVKIATGPMKTLFYGTMRSPTHVNCPAELELVFPKNGHVASRVTASPLAEFDVDVRSSDGRRLDALVQVNDATDDLPLAFALSARSGLPTAPDPTLLDAIDPTRVTIERCAGVVTLRVSHPGYARAVESVNLASGVGPTVSIVLHPE